MSQDLSLYLQQDRLPSVRTWNRLLREAGFKLKLPADLEPAEDQGWVPCGDEIGFEYLSGPLDETVVDGPNGSPADWDITLCCQSDESWAAAYAVLACLASHTGGYVSDMQTGEELVAEEALARANALQQALPRKTRKANPLFGAINSILRPELERLGFKKLSATRYYRIRHLTCQYVCFTKYLRDPTRYSATCFIQLLLPAEKYSTPWQSFGLGRAGPSPASNFMNYGSTSEAEESVKIVLDEFRDVALPGLAKFDRLEQLIDYLDAVHTNSEYSSRHAHGYAKYSSVLAYVGRLDESRRIAEFARLGYQEWAAEVRALTPNDVWPDAFVALMDEFLTAMDDGRHMALLTTWRRESLKAAKVPDEEIRAHDSVHFSVSICHIRSSQDIGLYFNRRQMTFASRWNREITDHGFELQFPSRLDLAQDAGVIACFDGPAFVFFSRPLAAPVTNSPSGDLLDWEITLRCKSDASWSAAHVVLACLASRTGGYLLDMQTGQQLTPDAALAKAATLPQTPKRTIRFDPRSAAVKLIRNASVAEMTSEEAAAQASLLRALAVPYAKTGAGADACTLVGPQSRQYRIGRAERVQAFFRFFRDQAEARQRPLSLLLDKLYRRFIVPAEAMALRRELGFVHLWWESMSEADIDWEAYGVPADERIRFESDASLWQDFSQVIMVLLKGCDELDDLEASLAGWPRNYIHLSGRPSKFLDWHILGGHTGQLPRSVLLAIRPETPPLWWQHGLQWRAQRDAAKRARETGVAPKLPPFALPSRFQIALMFGPDRPRPDLVAWQRALDREAEKSGVHLTLDASPDPTQTPENLRHGTLNGHRVSFLEHELAISEVHNLDKWLQTLSGYDNLQTAVCFAGSGARNAAAALWAMAVLYVHSRAAMAPLNDVTVPCLLRMGDENGQNVETRCVDDVLAEIRSHIDIDNDTWHVPQRALEDYNGQLLEPTDSAAAAPATSGSDAKLRLHALRALPEDGKLELDVYLLHGPFDAERPVYSGAPLPAIEALNEKSSDWDDIPATEFSGDFALGHAARISCRVAGKAAGFDVAASVLTETDLQAMPTFGNPLLEEHRERMTGLLLRISGTRNDFDCVAAIWFVRAVDVLHRCSISVKHDRNARFEDQDRFMYLSSSYVKAFGWAK
ncbi:hypothetical protein [Viridibacterium curvum]|uniref:Uncharacterized protein n=1 Tax=Viridibacterium curvum TaxID=1101404 RepID=A0ABP9QQD6_9RHOO